MLFRRVAHVLNGWFALFFETGYHYVALTGLELPIVDHDGLEFKEPHVSAPWVMRLKVHNTTPGSFFFFLFK